MPFDGATYERTKDGKRLFSQLRAVEDLLITGEGDWYTLQNIVRYLTWDKYRVYASEASVSARLRDLRKPKFGSHTVERKRITGGLWAYRIKPSFELEMQ